MSMNVGAKKGGAIAEINVTPMADIMIVLLIIFMVVTPMLSKGVDVQLPRAANTHERQDNPRNVVVAVRNDAERTVFLNNVRLASHAELPAKLREKIDELPDTGKVVFLKADVALPYTEAMKVMDICRKAGAEEVALIAEKKVQG